MKRNLHVGCVLFALVSLLTSSTALAGANRVFVSARSGNNANACDSVNTPCQTFAGAVTQLNPDGELIVLDTGGYGPVTITQGITIEAPAGVTAFVHPPSGVAVTVNAPGATVTLRGLVLNVGTIGIEVQAVGTLNVESCSLTGFPNGGIHMGAGGNVVVKNTDVKKCGYGILFNNSSGTVTASIDHCHLDDNVNGFFAATTSPGASTTTATNSTASNNSTNGLVSGSVSTGLDVLNLEFCTVSGNAQDGIVAQSNNPSSRLRYSNSVFSNNGVYGVACQGNGTCESRSNNTMTGNGTAATFGTIGTFTAM